MTTSTVQELPNRVNSGGGKATLGSTTSSDTNDPVALDHDGEHYVWGHAVAGNYLSVPDEAAFDVAGDFEVLVRAYRADWDVIPAGGTWDAFGSRFDGPSGSTDSWIWRRHTGSARRHEFVYRRSAASTTAFIFYPTGVMTGWMWLKVHVDVDDGSGNTVCSFYYADDSPTEPASWTLAGTDTNVGTGAIDAGDQVLMVGSGNAASRGMDEGIKRFIFRDLDGGSTDLADINLPVDIDTSADPDAGQASFTATTGQTVTVNRATSGLVTTVVTRPVLVLDGTDDYVQLPSDDTPVVTKAAGKFTGVVAFRKYLAATTFERLISFESAGTHGAYMGCTNSNVPVAYVGDTATAVNQTGGAYDLGDLEVWAFIIDTGTLYFYRYGDSLTAGVALSGVTSEPVYGAGRLGNLGYGLASSASFDCELFASLSFKDVALTQGQLDTLAVKLINGDYT